MATNYDALYRDTPNLLGQPNDDVMNFVAGLPGARSVLDIGCGQGRDALAIARLGHRVHGVDLSAHGVSQMMTDAKEADLPVTGEVADLTDYAPDGSYDLLLIDRTLHMILEDAVREAIFARLLGVLPVGGWLLLLDEPSNMAGFAAVLDAGPGAWDQQTSHTRREPNRPDTGTLFAKRTA